MRAWKRLIAWLKRKVPNASANSVSGAITVEKPSLSTTETKPLQVATAPPLQDSREHAISSQPQPAKNAKAQKRRGKMRRARERKAQLASQLATNPSTASPTEVELELLRYYSPLSAFSRQTMSASEKGKTFEEQVAVILRSLRATNPAKVNVKMHPKIILQNQELVIPDFRLRVELAHERRHYLIECRDRERDTKDILHKIRHVRDKQRWQTFLFLYPAQISSELARVLDAEGVMHLNLDAFRLFVLRLQAQLIVVEKELPKLLSKTELDQPKPDGAMLSSSPWR